MKELTVRYQGLGAAYVVGTLADDGRQLLFQYAAEALEQGRQLSPLRLPLRMRAYPDRLGEYASLHHLPGLICDSLPDGWGYRLLHRRLKTLGLDISQLSALDVLAYLGDNTMGALTYAPAYPESLDARDLDLLALAQEIQAVQSDESHEVLAELARAGGSAGGARPKALVFFNPDSGQMGTLATPNQQIPGAQPWLVKFAASTDAPDSCAVEALYAQLAHACQLGMADTRFFPLPDGSGAFATQRFDRQDGKRLHVHTLAGLLHANFQVPSVSYEDFFRVTRRLTRDQRQLQKAVQRCAFNILMNNRDDHAKNLSFMQDANAGWQLAPPYDLSYCSGHRGQHFMDVAGESAAPTRQHIIQAATSAGLPAAQARDAIDHILHHATLPTMQQLAAQLPLRSATLQTLRQAMQGNWERLAG